MAASGSGGAGPPPAQLADSDDDIMGVAFERACRAASLRAEARSAAQEALRLFAAELAPPTVATGVAAALGAAEPSAAANPGGVSGLPAASSTVAHAEFAAEAGSGSISRAVALTPKRKRDTGVAAPEPPSPEDDAAWNAVSMMSQSPSSSSSLASPLGRLRVTQTPPAVAGPASSSNSEMIPAGPLPPVSALGAVVAASALESSAEVCANDVAQQLSHAVDHQTAAALGAEASAAPPQPADAPNWECMSSSSESSSVDTPTLIHRMVRNAELEAELELAEE